MREEILQLQQRLLGGGRLCGGIRDRTGIHRRAAPRACDRARWRPLREAGTWPKTCSGATAAQIEAKKVDVAGRLAGAFDGDELVAGTGAARGVTGWDRSGDLFAVDLAERARLREFARLAI